jgi:predicted HicB family RNase H-like nuclease
MTDKEHISLYVSAEVKERLVLLAKCNERSLTQYIELLITDRLPKQEKPEEHDLVAA